MLMIKTLLVAALLSVPAVAGAQTIHDTHQPVYAKGKSALPMFRQRTPAASGIAACHPETSKGMHCVANQRARADRALAAQKRASKVQLAAAGQVNP